MIVRIELPQLETDVARSVLTAWRFAEGDDIGFGEPICDLQVTERVLPEAAGAGAIDLVASGRRRKKRRSSRRTSSGTFIVEYSVIASEPARLSRIVASPGQEVAAGELLGVAVIGDGDADEATLEGAPALRAIAKTPEIEELL